MSLHPKKSASKAQPRYTSVVFGGVIVSVRHTRRPRIHRLEASKPKGSGVGENKISFKGPA